MSAMKTRDVAPTLLFSIFVLLVSFLTIPHNSLQALTYSSVKNNSVRLKAYLSNQHTTPSQEEHSKSISQRPPWTHEPICTPHLDPLNSPLCIYTISAFNNSTGISISTTPLVASSLASLPILTDPAFTLPQPSSPPYALTAIPGKGLGLLATQPIPRLTEIMVTHPVLLARTEMILDTPDREKYLRIALSQLPTTTQDKYYDLVRMYNIESFAAQDVVRANSFEIGLAEPHLQHSHSHPTSADGPNTTAIPNTNEKGNTFAPTIQTPNGATTVMHLAIFPQAARLNHACNPNAMYHLNPDTLTHHVHATRDIRVGEEITVSYIGVMQDVSARRKMLSEGFGFHCTCERCLRDDGVAGATEEREHEHGDENDIDGDRDSRKKKKNSDVLSLLSSHASFLHLYLLSHPSYTPPAISTTHIHSILQSYLSLFASEGLEGFMDEAYKLAAVVSWRLGRKGEARRYARGAVEVLGMRYGLSHQDVERWGGWAGREEELVKGFVEKLGV